MEGEPVARRDCRGPRVFNRHVHPHATAPGRLELFQRGEQPPLELSVIAHYWGTLLEVDVRTAEPCLLPQQPPAPSSRA